MFERHLDKIDAFSSPGRVLDVGCATGDFLTIARERGWTVFGVDPSPGRAQALKRGLPLVGSTIQDADLEPGCLDVVTFWDVLEHLEDPIADLRRAKRLLRPLGVIAITVPDAGNVLARISGSRWFGYKVAGEHLQFFTRQSLRRAVARAGFDLIRQQPVTWSCSLDFLLNRSAAYLGVAGRLAQRILARGRISRMVIDVPMINQLVLARV
jgi:SAM-dependent methyltransferase